MHVYYRCHVGDLIFPFDVARLHFKMFHPLNEHLKSSTQLLLNDLAKRLCIYKRWNPFDD